VRRTGLPVGAPTLVIGAGPIGLGAAIFARIAGGVVTMMDLDARRLLAAAKIVGAASTIMAGENAPEAVSAATGGNGYDVVIDATGSRASMEKGFHYVAHGGTYVLLGVVRDDIAFADAEFHKREMILMASRNALRADFDHVIACIAAGKVPVAGLITHWTTIAGAITDLPRWATDKRDLIKALIVIG
jgi:2-desacetyl-2-hydroxyethyl bacteriochlorophyllide A dehydrogenase